MRLFSVLFIASMMFAVHTVGGEWDVEFRLVRYDRPEATVPAEPAFAAALFSSASQEGGGSVREGLIVTDWIGHVSLDGVPLFERYIAGKKGKQKYIGRHPVARRTIKPGKHTIWPGNHVFTLSEEGGMATEDPDLLIEGRSVGIRCYPLTVRARLTNPPDDSLSPELLRTTLPELTLRDAGDHARPQASPKGAEPRDLIIPVRPKDRASDAAYELILYAPANREERGYLLHPLGLTFHLDREGVQLAAGEGTRPTGVSAGGFAITLGIHQFPAQSERKGAIDIQGAERNAVDVETKRVELGGGHTARIRFAPRLDPYLFRISNTGPVVAIDPDLKRLPVKRMTARYTDPAIGAQRGLVLELPSRLLVGNETYAFRLSAIDSRPAMERERAERDAKQMIEGIQKEIRTLERDRKLSKPDAKGPDKNQPAQSTPRGSEATKRLDGLRKQLAEREAELDTLRKAHEAPAPNPLAGAPRFLRLQSQRDRTWIELPLRKQEGAMLSAAVPELPEGVYRLRAGVTPAQPPLEAVFVDEWVVVGRRKEAGVGAFLSRGRSAFLRGETFWIAVAATPMETTIPPSTPVSLRLVDDRGREIPLLETKTASAMDHARTWIVRLDAEASRGVPPGRYGIRASVGDMEAAPLDLVMVDPEPATHFDLFAYSLDSPATAYLEPGKAAAWADALARWGFNGFGAWHLHPNRIRRSRLEIESVYRNHPFLGPWESRYQPSGRDRFLDAALAGGLRVWETAFAYNQCMLPRDETSLLAGERFVALETQSLAHNPAFAGLLLYSSFQGGGDAHTPPAITRLWQDAEAAAFTRAHDGQNPQEALSALNRFIGRPSEQRRVKDIETFRAWPRYRDAQWRVFSERMASACRDVSPKARVMTLQQFSGQPGGNLAQAGTPADIFAPLDIAAGIAHKYGGRGDWPFFAGLMADSLRINDQAAVWSQVHSRDADGRFAEHLRRSVFLALSQKADGINWLNVLPDPAAPLPDDTADALKDINRNLLTPYGDFFRALDKGYRKVAIYYSRDMDFLSASQPNPVSMQVEGLWIACLRAGYPADILRDHQVKAGEGRRYDVIFVPGVYYAKALPDDVRESLQALLNAGKTLLVERSSRLPLDGIVRLDHELSELDDRLGGSAPTFIDFETDVAFERTESMTALIRQTLRKYVAPAAEHDLPVGPDWLRGGAGEYMVLPNYARTGFSTLHKTLFTAPARARLRFPKRPPACYDVLAMAPVPVAEEDDWMTIDADLRGRAGGIYAFLPERIGQVRVYVPVAMAAGGILPVRAEVLSEKDVPIDAVFPVEITLADPAGREMLRVYRAAAPTLAFSYPMPAHHAAGEWTVTVRELIAGHQAAAKVKVDATRTSPVPEDKRAVWAYRPQRIESFLREDGAVRIVLDRGQAWAVPQAERLRKALADSGREASVVRLDDVVLLPQADYGKTGGMPDGSRLWRGTAIRPEMRVPGPVIVLGRRGEHRLIEAAVRRELFPDPPTTHFPGPGRAVAAWMDKAFSLRHDAVLLVAEDEAGLGEGVDALIRCLAGEAQPSARAPLPKEETCPPVQTPAPSEAFPPRPTPFAERLRQHDAIRTLDFDPAAKRVLAGTAGYGENLFCLDAQGKVLWKVFLPDHQVYFARWIDKGRAVVAATAFGHRLFFLDGATGKIRVSLPATEWPRMHGGEGPVDAEPPVRINEPLRQVLVLGKTGLLCLGFDGAKRWFYDRARAIVTYPPDWEQVGAASFGGKAQLNGFALSPDGKRICVSEMRITGSADDLHGNILSAWGHFPAILDAATGKELARNTQESVGSTWNPNAWGVFWPSGSSDPFVEQMARHAVAPLRPDGRLGAFRIKEAGAPLPDGGRLQHTPNRLARYGADGNLLWWMEDDVHWMHEEDVLAQNASRLYRRTRDGRLCAIDMVSGKVLWQRQLPSYAILLPLDDGVLAGTRNGRVLRLNHAGETVWDADVSRHRQWPEMPYASYLQQVRAALPDQAGDVYPVARDRPGDLDDVVRMGREQLVHGGFESADAWESSKGAVERAAGGRAGKFALKLSPGERVTQALNAKVIPQATYLLEFHYRIPSGGNLIAGTKCDEDGVPRLTASVFQGGGEGWAFGRLAVKTPAKVAGLTVGFEAENDEVLVDEVSLRPIRFPSANLLAHEGLHAIEPTFVEDFRVQYNRIPGAVREDLMKSNYASVFRQQGAGQAVIWLEEQAYLQNGRIDDIGPRWYYMPDSLGYSVVLQQPTWISHVVLYLNNAMPDTVYDTISILANNLETKVPECVALVRGNRRRFLVVPLDRIIQTDAIKILPGCHPGHSQALTEIELYGPLGGPDMTADNRGFPDDPDGWPMLMRASNRVVADLPPDVGGAYRPLPWGRGHHPAQRAHPVFRMGANVAKNVFMVADADGALHGVSIPDPAKKQEEAEGTKAAKKRRRSGGNENALGSAGQWRFSTLPPTTTPVRYAGRFLIGGADGKLHAVAENGHHLWAFSTGGPVQADPVPDGDEVFVGSDDGNLYKVDLDSGILLWEFSTGGPVRGGLTLAGGRLYATSADGHAYALEAESGRLAWKAPLAADTRATPAVHKGRVFVGDEDGRAHAFDANSGKALWTRDMGGRIAACPVVTNDAVCFASDAGVVSCFGRNGQERWRIDTGSSLTGQPVPTATQLLVPTSTGLRILRRSDGADVPGVAFPEAPEAPLLSVVPYRGMLVAVYGSAMRHEGGYPILVSYIRYQTHPVVWVPAKDGKENHDE